jgi:hypothetical protein
MPGTVLGPAEQDSPPNYLAYCVEGAIDYINPASDDEPE